MDWEAAGRSVDPATVEGRCFAALRRLGEVRRKTLLRHFGSLKKLRAATVEEIAALPGFGRRTADAVVAALGEESRGPAVSVNTATGEIEES